jgi:hypothetical protein
MPFPLCIRRSFRASALLALAAIPVALWLIASSPALAADPAAQAKAVDLDGFPSGPWQGANAVYQCPNFDAVLSADRVLRIQPKENGKNVGAPVLVRFNAYFAQDNRSVGRELVSLEKRPAPAMQPKKVELAGHYNEKVRFAVAFTFTDRGVTIDGTIKDPPGLKQPTTLAYAAYFSATHQIPPNTPDEEIKKQVAGNSIKLTDAKRQSRSLEFWEISPTLSNAMAVTEVSGPWGGRRVLIDTPATRTNGGRLGNLGNYYNTPFFKGSWYISRGGSDKAAAGPLTVRVE